MSKRRQREDWVRPKPNAGFVGESDRLKAQIVVDDYGPCFLCDDPKCKEWATLWTEPDPENDNKRHMLCHVPECQMEDI